MATNSEQGLVEGVENLVVSQSADKSPPSAASIALEVSPSYLDLPSCVYDECLTEPVVHKLWESEYHFHFNIQRYVAKDIKHLLSILRGTAMAAVCLKYYFTRFS